MYIYLVKKGPVGPRDVNRGANLISPSVTYRHLQKFQEMRLLTKNEYGNHIENERALNRRFLDVEEVTKAKGMLIHVSQAEKT